MKYLALALLIIAGVGMADSGIRHHPKIRYVSFPEDIPAVCVGDTMVYRINKDTLEVGFYHGEELQSNEYLAITLPN